jgi:hypothetical protein
MNKGSRRGADGSRHAIAVSERSLVELPPGVGLRFEVYVNGVPQQEGRDFVRAGNTIVFPRRLAKEGRLGFWRWLSICLGIAGTYRQNDSVDVVYDLGGRRIVATGLPMTTETEPADSRTRPAGR